MAIEFNLATLNDMLLGFSIAEGEDEHGHCIMYSFGFLLFSIDIVNYKTEE